MMFFVIASGNDAYINKKLYVFCLKGGRIKTYHVGKNQRGVCVHMSTQTNNAILEFSNEERDGLGLTGEKIIADRYLQKGGVLENGAIVIAVADKKRPKPELGRVIDIQGDNLDIVLRDGSKMTVVKENVDVLKERAPRHMWKRIAKGVVAGIKAEKQKEWEDRFYHLQQGWKYLPGGRINASMGAEDADGNPVKTTSYNCFVIPNVGPSISDYAKSFGRSLEIQARSGGVGMNLSFVLPQGTLATPKPVRKSNMQLVMDVWHPDLLDFVEETPIERISNPYANSLKVVRVNRAFVEAVENDEQWTLEFPDVTAFRTNYPDLDYDGTWNGDLATWKSAGLPVKAGESFNARELRARLEDSGIAIVEQIMFAKEVSPGDSRGTIAIALEKVWEALLSGNAAAVVLSHLRPRYSRVVGVNGRSSGAYSWGALYNKANWAYAQGFGPVAVADIMSTGCLLTIQGGSRKLA
jgi:ribonucleoside-diphosphate reductase alpha chain